jgi:hypothetical protein
MLHISSYVIFSSSAIVGPLCCDNHWITSPFPRSFVIIPSAITEWTWFYRRWRSKFGLRMSISRPMKLKMVRGKTNDEQTDSAKANLR